jgi:hypothetical protein
MHLLGKKLKIEFIYRVKWIFIIVLIVIILIMNLTEHITNYLFFYAEINLNEIEYIHYNNIYYTNNLISFNAIEYDWYVNYNVFPIYFLNVKNTFIYTYIFLFSVISMPYILYECYLYFSPACYSHEKFYFLFFIKYNSIAVSIYFMNIDLASFFFFWTEDSYTYIYNEWNDFFININNLSNIYLFNFLFYYIYIQIAFLYIKNDYIYNYVNIFYKNKRVILNIVGVIILTIIYKTSNIEILFLTKYIFLQFFFTEIIIVLHSMKLFIKKIDMEFVTEL